MGRVHAWRFPSPVLYIGYMNRKIGSLKICSAGHDKYYRLRKRRLKFHTKSDAINVRLDHALDVNVIRFCCPRSACWSKTPAFVCLSLGLRVVPHAVEQHTPTVIPDGQKTAAGGEIKGKWVANRGTFRRPVGERRARRRVDYFKSVALLAGSYRQHLVFEEAREGREGSSGLGGWGREGEGPRPHAVVSTRSP